jgi:hypothetical protein
MQHDVAHRLGHLRPDGLLMPAETVGEAAHLYTEGHPPRTDSPTYVAARKVLMHTRRGGCMVCGGLPDMTHPELGDVADPTGLQDHHGGGVYVKDVLVALNLFGTEWSLGWSADPTVGIHEIPFPIWLGQVTCDWPRWDMWAGTCGTLAVAPDPETGGAVVLHANPAHHPGIDRGTRLAAGHPIHAAAQAGVAA